MTDNKKDDPGKGPVWPGDRRPHATIDVQATEVGGQDKAQSPGEAQALPPPSPDSTGKDRSAFAERVATARAWSRKASESNTFLSHVAAGVAGAVLTLIVGALFGLFAAGNEGGEQLAPDVAKRLAALEQNMRQRAAPPAGDVTAKLAAAETRLKSLEEQARSVATLGDAQTKLAADVKSLEGRSASPGACRSPGED